MIFFVWISLFFIIFYNINHLMHPLLQVHLHFLITLFL